MKRVTTARVEHVERKAQALANSASAFDLDAWRDGQEDLTTVDPDWLARRQARLAFVAGLDDPDHTPLDDVGRVE
jgi:hypothetical protein